MGFIVKLTSAITVLAALGYAGLELWDVIDKYRDRIPVAEPAKEGFCVRFPATCEELVAAGQELDDRRATDNSGRGLSER